MPDEVTRGIGQDSGGVFALPLSSFRHMFLVVNRGMG
jgi:hypothetical protein